MKITTAKAIFFKILLGGFWCLTTITVTVIYYQSIIHLIIALWLCCYYSGRFAAKSLAVCIFVAISMFILLLSIDGMMVLLVKKLQYRRWLSYASYIILCIFMTILVFLLHRSASFLTKILDVLPAKCLYTFWLLFLTISIMLYLTNLMSFHTISIQYGFILNSLLSIVFMFLIGCFIFIFFK